MVGMTQSSPSIRLILCEYASVFADGTVTMIRGYIQRWSPLALPEPIVLFVVIQLVDLDRADRESDFTLEVLHPSGKVAVGCKGKLRHSHDHTSQFIIPVQMPADVPGAYTFSFTCEGAVGTETLTVQPQQAPAEKEETA